MQSYPTLNELIAADARSRELFHSFTPDEQVALQEQRQNIHTLADLQSFAAARQKQSAAWQAK